MRIQEKDLYHGAALTQIVEHPSFKALNKVDDRYGHYLINHDRRMLVKYRTNSEAPWQFSFPPAETALLKEDLGTDLRVFLCLVCGPETVAILKEDEFHSVLGLDVEGQQWVRVDLPPGGSMRVRGSAGHLTRTIPHNAFPKKVFM